MSDEERPGQRVRPEEWEKLGRGGFDNLIILMMVVVVVVMVE